MNAFSTVISIRWADIDANFHLRHSAYYDFGAQHRVNILAAHGLTMTAMQEQHCGPVLFREECVFKKEIHLTDTITITTSLAKMRADGSRFSIQHLFTREGGTTLCAHYGRWRMDGYKASQTDAPNTGNRNGSYEPVSKRRGVCVGASWGIVPVYFFYSSTTYLHLYTWECTISNIRVAGVLIFTFQNKKPLITTLLTSLAVLLRILSNPLGNVFQKQLTAKNNHPLLVNFLTYFLLSIICIVFASQVPWNDLPNQFWWYSVLGGIAGALGNGFLVKALQKGALSVLGPINAYKSIVGIIVGIFLLREIPGAWGVFGIALIIYGSYFVLDTAEERFSWALLKKKEIQYRIWAMILTAIEAVFVKKVILASSTTIAFISWCWFGAFFSMLLLLVYRLNIKKEIQQINTADMYKYLLLVLCVGTMQFTTNYAFEHMPVGYALALFQLSIIVSVLLGHRIFKESDIRKKLIGSAIMIAGSVVIILL